MSTRRVESFLLRIVVLEDQALSPEYWRGRIQHITSGSELQVANLSQAIAFISTHLAPLADYCLEFEEDHTSAAN